MKAIVIDIPGLHLGYLGCYGNDWIETPNFDRLAAGGVVFDQQYADCPGSPTPSAWTGRYGFPITDGHERSVPGYPDRLGELLKANNVVRHHVTAANQPKRRAHHPLMHVVVETSAVLQRVARDERWLLWISLPSLAPPWQIPEKYLEHYFDEDADADQDADAEEPADEGPSQEPLAPWLDPPAGPIDRDDDVAWQRLQMTYAAAVTHVDEALGLLLQQIDEADLGDGVLVVVTSSRGLALGEHGIIGDWRPWLHEELVHVPLIVRLPHHAEAGRRIFALTQPMDLLPTLLETFGASVPPDLHGHSLLPLAHGRPAAAREYVCSAWSLGERVEWAIRTPHWTLLLPVRQAIDDPPRSPQLFVKPDDRWELNNLLQQHLTFADRLEQTLRAFVAASQRPGALEIRSIQAPVLGR